MVTLALRQLLRLVREYPREPLLGAVREAGRYGLYDLDRLERMILRRVTREYFLLDGGHRTMTEELEQLLKNLKLRRMLEIYDEQLRAADKDDISYSEFVTRLVRAQWQSKVSARAHSFVRKPLSVSASCSRRTSPSAPGGRHSRAYRLEIAYRPPQITPTDPCAGRFCRSFEGALSSRCLDMRPAVTARSTRTSRPTCRRAAAA